jgi:hypothetical protein
MKGSAPAVSSYLICLNMLTSLLIFLSVDGMIKISHKIHIQMRNFGYDGYPAKQFSHFASWYKTYGFKITYFIGRISWIYILHEWWRAKIENISYGVCISKPISHTCVMECVIINDLKKKPKNFKLGLWSVSKLQIQHGTHMKSGHNMFLCPLVSLVT